MAQVGRISGPLLQENLERNGKDLSFETDLLYLDISSGRIGINTNAPTNILEVIGTTITTNLIVDTQVDINTLNIQNSSIQPFPGSLYLDSTSNITANSIQTDDLNFNFNTIKSTTTDTSIELRSNGTGTTEVQSNLDVYGNLHSGSNITAEGNIVFGNSISQDTVTIKAEVSSDVVPDVTSTYYLGSAANRWQDIESVLLNGVEMNSAVASVGGVNIHDRQGKLWYVSTNGDNSNVGDHQQGPFRTIDYAVTQATAGDTIFVYPGVYEETCPIEIPVGVSLVGHNQRNTIIEPASSQSTTDIFLINGETSVSNLTIRNFYYDSANDVGYAFRFATGGKVTTRSPYIQNITVITKGSVITANDPRGFNQGDAGKGVLVDGAVLASDTREASMLFHAITLITPGVDALTLTNGVRVEWLNSFTYFANRGAYITNGTGRVDDNLQTRYGAEMRSIGSANVYGNYGFVADGSDILIYLIMHNFGYIGSGTDSSNDNTLTIQANEVVETNGANVVYQSQSENGDFRVGDNFLIDFAKGDQSFDINDIPVVGVDTITVTTGTDVTYLDLNYVQTGNVRLTENTLASINGDLNITATSGQITLSDNVTIEQDLDVSGNLTIGGALLEFGNNQSIDVITFTSGIDTNLNPKTTDTYDIGSTNRRWNNVWLSRSLTDNITITNNFIETTQSNSDLELRASGTGNVLISDIVNLSSALTVTTGSTTFSGITTINSSLTLSDFTQTGDLSITGNVSLTETLSVDGSAQFENILFSGNTVNTTLSNSDLELRASTTGSIIFDDVLINNNLNVLLDVQSATATATTSSSAELLTTPNITIEDNYIESSTDLILSASGNISVDSNNVLIENNLDVGIDTFLNDTNVIGTITQIGNTTQFGNRSITGEYVLSGNLDIDSEIQFEDISIVGNIVSTTLSNSNLELRASATGNIVTNNNVVTNGLVSVTGDTTVTTSLTAITTNSEILNAGNIRIEDNYIESSTDLILSATGNVSIDSNDVVIENNLDVVQTSNLDNTSITGLITHTGNRIQTGDIDLTGDIVLDGDLFVDRASQFEEILISGNSITELNNTDLILDAAGTGNTTFNSNTSVGGSVIIDFNTSSLSVNVNQTASAQNFNTTDIKIQDNFINSSSNLVLGATGNVIVPFNDVTIQNNLDVVQTTDLQSTTIVGAVNIVGDTNQTGINNITGDVDLLGNLIVSSDAQFEEINIAGNVISTTDTDFFLRATGTGEILIPNNDVTVNQTLSVLTNILVNDASSQGQFDSPLFTTAQIALSNNEIISNVGDLILRANGTGRVLLESSLDASNNLTVLLTTQLSNTEIVGQLNLTGDRNITGDYTSTGDLSLSGNITATGIVFENIEFNDNYVTTSTSNADLDLRAKDNGIVRIQETLIVENNFSVSTLISPSIDSQTIITSGTFTNGDINIAGNVIETTTSNSNLDLLASGTGNVIISDLNLDQSLTTDGTTTLLDTTLNGSLTQTGNFDLTGNLLVQGNVSVNGIITVAGQVQLEEILIDDNIITTTSSNADLELRANGTGEIVIPSNNVRFAQGLSVPLLTTTGIDVDPTNSITSFLYDISDIEIRQNEISNTVTNNDLVLSSSSEFNTSSNVIAENNLVQTTVSNFSNTEVVGTITLVGDYNQTGSLDITGNITSGTTLDVTSKALIADIEISGNKIKTVSQDSDLIIKTFDTNGIISTTFSNVQMDQDLTVLGTINSSGISNTTILTADRFLTAKLEIFDNVIENNTLNDDIILSANATGEVIFDSNDVEITNDITVGTADLSDLSQSGDTTHQGSRTQIGDYDLSNNLNVSGNLDVSYVEFTDITVQNNVIETVSTNADLELRASGTGDVVIDDNTELSQALDANTLFSSSIGATSVNSSIFETSNISITNNTITTTALDLELSATDINSSVVLTSSTDITNNLTVSGTSNLADTTVNGDITQTGDRTITSVNIDGDLTVTGGFTTSVQFEEININDNVVTTTRSNADLDLRASGTGEVLFNVDSRIAQNLYINGVSNINDLTVESTTVDKLQTQNIEIDDNRITTTESNSDLELRAAGTGSVELEDISVNTNIISNNQSQSININVDGDIILSTDSSAKLPVGSDVQKTVNTAGDLRFNTDSNLFEGYSVDRISLGGVYSSDRQTNVVATNTSNELQFTVNGSQVASITETNFSINGIITPEIDINGSTIKTTVTNGNLDITTGTANLIVEDLEFQDSSIINNTNNALVLQNQGSGIVKLATSTGVKMPSGPSAQATSVEVGDTRWNTDTQLLETFDGNVYIAAAGLSNNITQQEFDDLLLEYTLIFG